MGKINEFIPGWLSHRKALLELAEVLKDEHLSYKPWEKGMTLSELVLHITGAMEMFANTVKAGKFTPPSPPEKVNTAAELKAVVTSQTEQTKAVLESLTDEQLDAIIEFSGRQMPGSALLEMAKEHEIHHKGQLFTYYRLVGGENLPFFISRS